MLPLDSSRWSDLRQAYGNASEFPAALKRIEAAAPNASPDDAVSLVADACHDWSTYDATYAVTPHLIDICGQRDASDHFRHHLLATAGWFAACLALNKTPAADDLVAWYNGSLRIAATLASESLPYTKPGRVPPPIVTRTLLGAFAAFHRDFELAFILYELDARGTKCNTCHAFFDPYVSSLNPFHRESGG